MLRLGTMAAGLLLSTALALPGAALAQNTPGLTYAQPLSPAAMTMIQERLRQAGVYSGRADGVWGPNQYSAKVKEPGRR